MDIQISLPKKIVDFFDSASKLFEWGFDSPENMLKHILLEGLEHRLEHMADSQNSEQHRELHKIIDEERLKCHPEEFLSRIQGEGTKQITK